MKISASGLALERLKMDTISSNISNINTTRTEDGGSYLKKEVVFQESFRSAQSQLDYGLRGTDRSRHMELGPRIRGGPKARSAGVKVTGIVQDEENLKVIYDPDHPDADENGYVAMPNVNMVDEMIALLNTQRTYDANVTALNASKSMLKKALEISKG